MPRALDRGARQARHDAWWGRRQPAAAGRGNARSSSRAPERGGSTRGSSRQNPRGSGRGPTRKNNKNTMVFVISGISLCVLIIITVVIANRSKAETKAPPPVSNGALSNPVLETRISKAMSRAGAAAGGNSISEIDAAIAEIRACMDEATTFVNSNGGSGNRANAWQDSAGVQRLNANIRLLNDRKSILQSQGR